MHSAMDPLQRDEVLGRKGLALIMVLWVLAILMVLVLSFSYMAKTEGLATLSFKEGVERKFLAEAGVARGIIEIFYLKANGAQNIVLEEGMEAWKADGTPYTVKTDTGRFVVDIIDESGKIDINTLNDTSGIILKNLLMNSGVKEEDADTIVDSVLDWKDADDLVRLHGAESDYYMSLPTPYKAKDANFDTLEELLLVKGVTPEILYGNKERKGVINFLTVYSKSSRISLGAAPKEVLAAVPGLTPELADQIVSLRGNQTDAQQIPALLANIPPSFQQFVTQGFLGRTFTLESVGYKGEEKAGYPVMATVTLTGTDYKFLYYKSPSYLRRDRENGDDRNDSN